MDIGKKIYELRKQNGMTQEQLAKAVGVSTPAVSKWETGTSMPDILLLAPIARKLHTTLDELLCFQESLTEKEVSDLVEEVKKTSRVHGLQAGMEQGMELIHRYPNVDELKLQIAVLPSMMAFTADKKYWEDDSLYQILLEQTTEMLEELIHSSQDSVRLAAMVSAVSRYMGQKRFEEAEKLLDRIPHNEFDTRHFFPSLYLLKGEEDKMMEYAQRNMLQDIQNILADIRGQQAVFLKRGEFNKALQCAQDYADLAKRLAPPALCGGSELLVDTFLALGDLEQAEQHFLEYLVEIENINGDCRDMLYYSYVADKLAVASSDIQTDVRNVLYKHILMQERYEKLRQRPAVLRQLNKLNSNIL